MSIPFVRYHALGNDYIVMDPGRIRGALELTPEVIRRICHRHLGVGSDGILYGPIPETKELRLRIFNPDGSEAEKSGNGIRIFSRYLLDEKYVTGDFLLETSGGQVRVEFLGGKATLIRVDMGRADFYRGAIEEDLEIGARRLRVSCVSMGNPHCVIPMKEISSGLAQEIGPLVEGHPLFPNRTNVQLLQIVNRREIRIEIWERGAGYTMASGSSSCAAASVAHRLGLVDSAVTVHMPGGDIGIEIRPDGHVLMTGPVTRIASGELDPECLA